MTKCISIDGDQVVYYDEYDEKFMQNFTHSLVWDDEPLTAIPLNVIFDNELITNEKQFYAVEDQLEFYINQYDL